MVNMKYRSLMVLSYDTIGKTILICLERNPDVQEFKFIARNERRISYDFSVLNEGEKIPAHSGHELKAIVDKNELCEAINDEFQIAPRPEQARVIRPDLKKDAWKIFLKR